MQGKEFHLRPVRPECNWSRLWLSPKTSFGQELIEYRQPTSHWICITSAGPRMDWPVANGPVLSSAKIVKASLALAPLRFRKLSAALESNLVKKFSCESGASRWRTEDSARSQENQSCDTDVEGGGRSARSAHVLARSPALQVRLLFPPCRHDFRHDVLIVADPSPLLLPLLDSPLDWLTAVARCNPHPTAPVYGHSLITWLGKWPCVPCADEASLFGCRLPWCRPPSSVTNTTFKVNAH